jgi:hypothetical protein
VEDRSRRTERRVADSDIDIVAGSGISIGRDAVDFRL